MGRKSRDITKPIKPRSKFDRMLAKLEQQRIWELTPAAVDKVIDITSRMTELGHAARQIEDPACAIRTELDCLKAASSLLVEVFIDRTLPTISRVDHQAVLAVLQRSREEIDQEAATASEDPVVRERAALREVLRRFCFGEPPALPPPGLPTLTSGEPH